MTKKDEIQTEALDATNGVKYAGVVLGTGMGKTFLGIKHMLRGYTDCKMFLVVAPKINILKGWAKEMQERGYDYLLENVHFCTYLSLHKQQLNLYDCVYLDESHNVKIKHTKWLELNNSSVLGLTGTPPRYKTSESAIAAKNFFPTVYEYTVDEAIEAGLLNKYKIYIHQLSLSDKKTFRTKFGVTSEQESYRKWCVKINNNPLDQMAKVMRMKTMQSYNTKIEYAKKLLKQQTRKTLVFTDYTEQADFICTESYHSKNKKSKENLELFKEGKINKLSSVQQIEEGENIKGLEVGIILHAYANEKRLPQKIGRFLRLNPENTGVIHLLCYKETIDMTWMKAALKNFNKEKIFKYDTTKTTHPA